MNEKKISSLSQAFPADTAYFYGYPVGWDSNFLNHCPPSDEELVAMRAAACAGPDVKVVVFASTTFDQIWNLLKDDMGVPYIEKDQLIVLPPSIDGSVHGHERNLRVKAALADQVSDHTLAMAQPYLDPIVRHKYLIDPNLSVAMNDKKNYDEYFPERHRVPEFARCSDGREFSRLSADSFEYPCVIKVSSSGSGDGVRLCKTAADFRDAQEHFKDCDGLMFVQKMIDIARETEVKFVIHHDQTRPAELIGYSDEITGTNGEYLGGVIVNERQTDPAVRKIFDVIQNEVAPIVRAKGWFGVAGIGVLIDKNGEFYLCDPNFRMTAVMPQVMEMNAGAFGSRSLLGFGGTYSGNIHDFKKNVAPRAIVGDVNQQLNVISMLENGGKVDFHGAVLFDQPESLRENVVDLQRLGIRSAALEAMHHVCLQKHLGQ